MSRKEVMSELKVVLQQKDQKEVTQKKQKRGGSNDTDASEKDKEGLINIGPGGFIHDRYEVISLAGQGTFGTVLYVYDVKRRKSMALKVVRSVERYLDAAWVEIKILKKIHDADTKRQSLCVKLYSTFESRYNGQNHVCLGFERLGMSLYDFIKKNKYTGFSLEHVKEIGHQLLQAIQFCHSIKLTHTDLKPENILFLDSNYRLDEKNIRQPINTEIRLIDFGGATFENEHHSRIVNTRQYRAVEIILGLKWSYPSDLWGVGCILAELFTGQLLFATHENLEHLVLLEKVMGGKIPAKMLLAAKELAAVGKAKDLERKGKKSMVEMSSKHASSFSDSRSSSLHSSEDSEDDDDDEVGADRMIELGDDGPRLRWPEHASSSSLKAVRHAKTVEECIPDQQFVSLLRSLLQFDPNERMTASQAIDHPFFGPFIGKVHTMTSVARTESPERKGRSRGHSDSQRDGNRGSGNKNAGRGDRHYRERERGGRGGSCDRGNERRRSRSREGRRSRSRGRRSYSRERDRERNKKKDSWYCRNRDRDDHRASDKYSNGDRRERRHDRDRDNRQHLRATQDRFATKNGRANRSASPANNKNSRSHRDSRSRSRDRRRSRERH